MFRHKIVCVRKGVVRDFASADRTQLLGLYLDAQHETLWAVGNYEDTGSLFAFDLGTGRQRLRVDGSSRGRHLFNDVTVSDDGTVYLTDSFAGAVWRLKPGARRLDAFLPPKTLFLPNGIISDGMHLLVAHEFGIVNVDADGRMQPLSSLPKVTLAGIDGIDRAGDVLLALQNGVGAPRIMRFDLNPDHTAISAATILETRNPHFRQPTAGAICAAKDLALVIADGFLNNQRQSPFFEDKMPSTTILGIPLGGIGTNQ